MATEYLYLDDYKVGDRMVSPARTITESDIVNFAALTGDWHPLHTDVEYAARTPFKGRIAHGMLVLSIGLSVMTARKSRSVTETVKDQPAVAAPATPVPSPATAPAPEQPAPSAPAETPS